YGGYPKLYRSGENGDFVAGSRRFSVWFAFLSDNFGCGALNQLLSHRERKAGRWNSEHGVGVGKIHRRRQYGIALLSFACFQYFSAEYIGNGFKRNTKTFLCARYEYYNRRISY